MLVQEDPLPTESSNQPPYKCYSESGVLNDDVCLSPFLPLPLPPLPLFFICFSQPSKLIEYVCILLGFI